MSIEEFNENDIDILDLFKEIRRNGDVEKIEFLILKLIGQNVDINQIRTYDDYISCLMYKSIMDEKLFYTLVKYIDVDRYNCITGNTLLMDMILSPLCTLEKITMIIEHSKNIDVYNQLTNMNYFVYYTALDCATIQYNKNNYNDDSDSEEKEYKKQMFKSIIIELLKNGANLYKISRNNDAPIKDICKSGDIDLLQVIKYSKYNDFIIIIWLAIKNINYDFTEYVIPFVKNINAPLPKGESLLQFANRIKTKYPCENINNIIELLIENGAK